MICCTCGIEKAQDNFFKKAKPENVNRCKQCLHEKRSRATSAMLLRLRGIKADRTEKSCCRCGVVKKRCDYHKLKRAKDGMQPICKECQFEQNRDYQVARKIRVIDHYSSGAMKCCRCGFRDLRALSIDHIDGGGYQERMSLDGGGGFKFYDRLEKTWPDGLQVLCMNCQFIKRVENGELRKRKE